MLPSRTPIVIHSSDFVAEPQSKPESLGVDEMKETLADIEKFSKSSHLSQLKQDVKLQRRVAKFRGKMTKVLSNLKKMEMDELNSVFLFVMQSATDYLYCADTEKFERIKQEICAELLCPLTGGDVKLCCGIMKIVEKDIKKSTVFRRNKKNIARGLSFF